MGPPALLARAARPARLRSGCAAARRFSRACSTAAGSTAVTKLPEAPTKTVFEAPSLLSVEKEVKDYAQLGCVLTACGGHGLVYALAADLPPLASCGILGLMAFQLGLSTNTAGIMLTAALSRSVTKVDLILDDPAKEDAVEQAMQLDEIRFQVTNDVMWHNIKLSRNLTGSDAQVTFGRLCELGIVPMKYGTVHVEQVVEFLRNTEYVIAEEECGWIREPPSKALKLPAWKQVTQEMCDKIDATQKRFGKSMVDTEPSQAILRLGQTLAAAGGLWSFAFLLSFSVAGTNV